MGTKINEARQCAEKIKYYHENAGIAGYSQAEPYYNKISTLATSAQANQKKKKVMSKLF